MNEQPKVAVLIDAENISAKYAATILAEANNLGNVIYKRIYGNWTTSQLSSWKHAMLDHAIQPIQQYSNTQGKNSSDSALIIDAMDLLYQKRLDAFCIVSSDSDFTRLASRLRESEMLVLGMGEQKTPRAFISACNRFVYLDLLYKANKESTQKKRTRRRKRHAEHSKVAELQAVQTAEIELTMSSETIPSCTPELTRVGICLQANAEGEDSGKTDRSNIKNETSQKEAAPTDNETPLKNREDEPEYSRRKRRGRSTSPSVEVEVEPIATTGKPDERAQSQTEYHQVSTVRDIEDIEYDDASDTATDEDIANGSDIDVVRDTLRSICEDASDDDGWIHAANLAEILSRRLTDFDYRNFGFKKFVPFVESLKMFESKSIKADGAPGRAVYFCLLEDWTK